MIGRSSGSRFVLAPFLCWFFAAAGAPMAAGQDWPEEVQRGLDCLESQNGDVYQGLAILTGLDLDQDVRKRLHRRLVEHPHRTVKLFALREMEHCWTDGAWPAVAAVIEGAPEDDGLAAAAARTLLGAGIPTCDEASEVARLLGLPRLGTTSRVCLIDLLGQSGDLARAAVARLEAELSSQAAVVRFAAFRALGRIQGRGGESAGGVDLGKAAYSIFASIQAEDVTSAESWIEPLLVLARDPDQSLVRRGAAVETAAVIAASDPRVVSGLLDLRLQSDPLLRELALEGLGKVPPGSAGMRRWAERLTGLDLRTQVEALAKLRELGPDAVFASEPLIRIWSQADGGTPDGLLAGVLDVFRAMGPAAVASGPRLCEFLAHEFAAYQGRDRLETIRLRAYLMVTLAEVGVPVEAHSLLVDSLAHIDERVVAIEVGAAARAVGSIGSRGRPFVPFLLEAVTRRFAEEEFSLARYPVDFPPEESTTVQIEALNALAGFGRPDDDQAIRLLERIADASDTSRYDPRAVAGAQRVLAAADEPREPAENVQRMSEWLEPDERADPIEGLEIHYTNQEGTEGTLKELVDRPTLVTFFYTRCQNNLKCSAAVTQIATLQTYLEATSLQDDARLLAITYEPEHDDTTRLKRFGENRGLRFGAGAQALRLEERRHESFLEGLDAPISFNGGSVNTHGVALYLFDSAGRLVRRYHTTLWDNDQVVQDVRRLLAESD